jgi:hypothetical protein
MQDAGQCEEGVPGFVEENTECVSDHGHLFQIMETELFHIHQRYLSKPLDDFEASLSPRHSRTSLEDLVTSCSGTAYGSLQVMPALLSAFSFLCLNRYAFYHE